MRLRISDCGVRIGRGARSAFRWIAERPAIQRNAGRSLCLLAAALLLGNATALPAETVPYSWGYNYYGQLGDGTNADRPTPVRVTGLSGVTAITSQGCHSLALKNDGTVWAWGNNGNGELGDGTTTDRWTPVQVTGVSGVTAISGGAYYSLALKNDGTVWSWGTNGNGELGDGTTTDRWTPVQVTGLSGVTAIAKGDQHPLALKNDGTVWAWGYNGAGQLGDGTTTNRSTPVQVAGLSGVTAIAGGCYHSLALKNDATVWAWGANGYGQLGDGTNTNRLTPVQVTGLSSVTAIAAGQHSLALKNDGTVWAWGFNYYGELGDGTTTDRWTPVQVTGLSGVTTIAGGYWHSLAVKNDGTVWSWGYNRDGELGDGTTTDRWTPVQVTGLRGITAITATGGHCLALGSAPPVISSVSATVGGAAVGTVMLGTTVTFSVTASDPNNAPLTYTWDFKDGGTATGNPATHAFTAAGTFQVSVTVNNGSATANGSVSITVYAPSSAGAGEPIVSQVVETVVTNPLTGVKVSVANSNGGVVELLVDVWGLLREDFSVATEFVLPSRAAFPVAAGLRPVAQFTNRGIAVATASVTKTADGTDQGKARKMLPLSALETDDPELPHLAMPSSRYVAVKSLKGKFNFAGRNDAKPDAVALSGTITLATGLDISKDQELWIGAGNIVDRIMLDPKGNAKSRSTGDSGRIKKVKIKWPRLGKGVTTTSGGEHAQASVTFNLVDMDKEGFDTEGVTGQLRPDEAGQTSVPRQVQLAIVLGGVSYETLSDVEFKVTKDLETGQITLPSRH